MSVLKLSSRTSLSSSSQPTKNLGAPRRLSPGLLGSDITVPRGSPQRSTTPSHTNTPMGEARGRGKGWPCLSRRQSREVKAWDTARSGEPTAGQASAVTSLLRFLMLHSANSHLRWLVWVSYESSATWRLKLQQFDVFSSISFQAWLSCKTNPLNVTNVVLKSAAILLYSFASHSWQNISSFMLLDVGNIIIYVLMAHLCSEIINTELFITNSNLRNFKLHKPQHQS